MLNLYYSLILILVAMEMKGLITPKEHLEEVNKVHDKLNVPKEKLDVKNFSSKEAWFILGEYFYLAWILIGIIFMPERIGFAAIFLLSFIPKSKLGAWWVLVDSLLSIAILIMIILNHFFTWTI